MNKYIIYSISLLLGGLTLTGCTNPLGDVSIAPTRFQPGLQDSAPQQLVYTSPVIYSVSTVIAPNAPVSSGTPITAYTISPALPAGLSLNPTTGIISGTPSAVSTATSYIVTGSTQGGSTTALVQITVASAPPVITYTGSPFTLTKNSSAGSLSPTSSGGAIVSCSTSPTLPAGLALTSTCVISGTPTTTQAATAYTVTAQNSGGSATASISIAVNDIAPAFSYTGTPFTFTKDASAGSQSPTNTGGTITSCASSPTLPTGLSVAADCTLSGTPTGIQTATSYTITATNSGGSATATISITVRDVVPAISYASSPFTFTKGSSAGSSSPTNTGGAIVSCTSSATLPAGLSLSAACVISGTPTALQTATSYTITATNSGGSATATISITVNDVVPAISYSSSPFSFSANTAITSQTPANTGGTIVSCTSSATLPAGLSLSAVCVISGTPTTTQTATNYTITATNSGGSATATISIEVTYAYPTVTSLSRNAGTNGNTITLTGTGFRSGLVVAIGATNCTTSTYVSATSATCVVAASTSIALLDVKVTNSDTKSGTLTASFTHLMDASFWLRGDVATTSGGFVDSWTDLSGNNIHATQTGATRPAYTSSVAALNNQPALLFNGTSSALDLAAGTAVLRDKAGLAWGAALTTADNTQVQQSVWSFSTNSSGSTRFSALLNDTNSGTNLCAASGFVSTSGRKTDGGSTWYQCRANATPANNAAFVASGNANFTANTVTSAMNGSTVDSNSVAANYNSAGTNTTNTASAIARIGTGNTGTRLLKGYLAEVVFYNYDIGTTNRQALETYLKTRYNVP